MGLFRSIKAINSFKDKASSIKEKAVIQQISCTTALVLSYKT